MLILNRAKAAIALFTAICIYPVVRQTIPMVPDDIFSYGILAIQEVMIGATIGTICSLVIAAFPTYGQFFSFPMGLGIMNVFDPLSQQQTPVISQLIGILTLLAFLAIGGPQMILKTVCESFTILPVLKLSMIGPISKGILDVFCKTFFIAFSFSLPILGTIFLCEVGLGLMSRASPQMNLMMFGWPIKILIGLATCLILQPLIYEKTVAVFNWLFDTLRDLMFAVGG
jgi:flagellar biosynthetic protein FliR